VSLDVEGNFLPMLATEWSLAPDNLTWTFRLQKGVQFSKGYGEMTADDVIYSYETYGSDDAINARKSTFKRLWRNEAGSVKKLDDYTIEVNTGTVQYDMLFLASNSTIGWIVSKKQTDDVGVEAASIDIATTGTFEIVDHATGQFWKMKAVEDHWRKTPFFAEMMWHEILEESTRVANFQVGRLDTMNMDLDSLPSIQRVADVKFMRVEGGAIENVALYGQYYTNVGTADQKPGYDPSLAYVSSNPDLNSDEWAQAVMVRKAMTMAIDRQLIVDTIIKGEGTPGTLWGFDQWGAANFDADIAKGWGFDPAAAKQLLVDAGYPNGFDVTITPLIRNVPGEVDACHAAGQFWEDIGINVELKSLTFSAFVPTIAAREYSGVGCQGTNGRLDPLSLMVIFRHDSFFTAGLDHPKITELADKALAIVDTEERNVVTKQIARFFFDNALNFGLYGLNVIWPLGAKIDDWSDKMEYADPKMISRFEWVPHR
jgi:peptide/nickel transport system substrate-binding protein